MKTLDDAVIELGGVWPATSIKCAYMEEYLSKNVWRAASTARTGEFLFTKEQFQQRAKQLGFVGKYRWGVEYPTNGKKPDLADDVLVRYWTEERCSSQNTVLSLDWRYDYNECHPIIKFKITDQRYKPADTSYLDKPDSSLDKKESSLDSTADWYCYETQTALRLPPVGVEVEWSGNGGRHWYKTALIFSDETLFMTRGYQLYKTVGESIEFRPLDWNRKTEAEKKRVVTAAYADLVKAGCVLSNLNSLYKLYDLGYLRLPANKD
jgi:hypothetical protein